MPDHSGQLRQTGSRHVICVQSIPQVRDGQWIYINPANIPTSPPALRIMRRGWSRYIYPLHLASF